jgi:hypothetical protein
MAEVAIGGVNPSKRTAKTLSTTDDGCACRDGIQIFRGQSAHLCIERSLFQKWSGEWIPSLPW